MSQFKGRVTPPSWANLGGYNEEVLSVYNGKILYLFLEAEASLRPSNRLPRFFSSQAQKLKNAIFI